MKSLLSAPVAAALAAAFGGVDAAAQCSFAELQASDAALSDWFGHAQELLGDTLFVAAPRRDAPVADAGGVYVFLRDDGGTPLDPNDDAWLEQTCLEAADAIPGHYLGDALAVQGTTLLVGASRHTSTAPDTGSVYAYERDDNATPADPTDDVWVQFARIDPIGAVLSGADHDLFGNSVSLDGETALVGARDDAELGNLAGAAYILERDDNGTPTDPFDDLWVQTARLKASDAGSVDIFGLDVCLQGDTALVGAPLWDGAAGSNQGAVYVFHRDDKGTPGRLDDEWLETHRLVASDAQGGYQFGTEVIVEGDFAVVGANNAPFGTSTRVPGTPGKVYFLQRDDRGTADPFDDLWVEVDVVSSGVSELDRFGQSLALEGDLVAIGANWASDRGDKSGAVYVYERSDAGTPGDPFDDAWGLYRRLVLVTGEAGDDLGFYLSLDGRLLLAGARLDDGVVTDCGAVHAFDLDQVCAPFVGVRDGSGANPACLTSATLPQLGSVWRLEVDNTFHPSPWYTILVARDRPLSPGVATNAGELLTDVMTGGVHLYTLTLSSPAGLDVFEYLVPTDPVLIGLQSFLQAAVVGSGDPRLCNALDVVLGS